MDKISLGTTIKLAVKIKAKEGAAEIDLKDCNFEAKVWASNINDAKGRMPSRGVVSIQKSDCVEDGDAYIVAVDTDRIGRGYVMIMLDIAVEDEDVGTGIRHERPAIECNVLIY